MTYMAQVIITSPQAVGKAKIKAVDTYNYVVIPNKGTVKQDLSKPLQKKVYKINNRTTTKLTVQRLKREKDFDCIATRKAIEKITADYNAKYSSNGFPNDYYVLIGKLLVTMMMIEVRPYKELPQYVKTSIALTNACVLVDGEEGFLHGKGAPLFHIYENVVRKNDDTGIDKLMHFLYSAKHAYMEGGKVSRFLGTTKEFVKDEMYSWITDDKGWDDLDMEANRRGIEFGRKLPRR